MRISSTKKVAWVGLPTQARPRVPWGGGRWPRVNRRFPRASQQRVRPFWETKSKPIFLDRHPSRTSVRSLAISSKRCSNCRGDVGPLSCAACSGHEVAGFSSSKSQKPGPHLRLPFATLALPSLQPQPALARLSAIRASGIRKRLGKVPGTTKPSPPVLPLGG